MPSFLRVHQSLEESVAKSADYVYMPNGRAKKIQPPFSASVIMRENIFRLFLRAIFGMSSLPEYFNKNFKNCFPKSKSINQKTFPATFSIDTDDCEYTSLITADVLREIKCARSTPKCIEKCVCRKYICLEMEFSMLIARHAIINMVNHECII